MIFTPRAIAEFKPQYAAKSLNYLYRSATNYASLFGKKLDPRVDDSDLKKLFHAFEQLLPQGQYLELKTDTKKKRLNFHVVDDRNQELIYYLPCQIVNQVEGELRDIYLNFFSIFQETQGLRALQEDPCFDYFKEELELENEEADTADEWFTLLASYTKGIIADTLAAVNSKPRYSIPTLKQKIQTYQIKNENEGSKNTNRLLALMYEGLAFFEQDCIMSYSSHMLGKREDDDDDYKDSDDQEYPVSMDRMIQIVYTDDLLTENCYQWTNEEIAQSGYEFLSAGNLVISPKTTHLIEINAYVELFLNWLNQLCYELYNPQIA